MTDRRPKEILDELNRGIAEAETESAWDAFISLEDVRNVLQRLDRAEGALKEIADTVDSDRYADKGAIWCADVARTYFTEAEAS